MWFDNITKFISKKIPNNFFILFIYFDWNKIERIIHANMTPTVHRHDFCRWFIQKGKNKSVREMEHSLNLQRITLWRCRLQSMYTNQTEEWWTQYVRSKKWYFSISVFSLVDKCIECVKTIAFYPTSM